MVKAQYDKHNDRVSITIPKDKAKTLGWYEKVANGETVDLDVSTLPDMNGVSVREI